MSFASSLPRSVACLAQAAQRLGGDEKNKIEPVEGQVADLVRLYQSEWWTKGRRESEVHDMLRHCDLIVAVAEASSGRLVGFARVLTDFVREKNAKNLSITARCAGLLRGYC